MGVTRQVNTPGSYVSKLPEAQPMIMKDPNSQEEQQKVFSYLLKLAASPPVKAFMDPKVTSTVWKENVKLADENNHPGKFTAFCSYVVQLCADWARIAVRVLGSWIAACGILMFGWAMRPS